MDGIRQVSCVACTEDPGFGWELLLDEPRPRINWAQIIPIAGAHVHGFAGTIGRKRNRIQIGLFSVCTSTLAGLSGPDWRAETFVQVGDQVFSATSDEFDISVLDLGIIRKLRVKYQRQVLVSLWYFPRHGDEVSATDVSWDFGDPALLVKGQLAKLRRHC